MCKAGGDPCERYSTESAAHRIDDGPIPAVIFTDGCADDRGGATSTVRDLVVGSDLSFGDRGSHQLKGVPGTWTLLAVER